MDDECVVAQAAVSLKSGVFLRSPAELAVRAAPRLKLHPPKELTQTQTCCVMLMTDNWQA